MAPRCERPGCSDLAAVAYGMRNDTLTVWLQLVPDGAAPVRTGMLCRRHADAMIVPRGWSLDDRRENTPRLFKVPQAPPAARSLRRKRHKLDPSGHQLSFAADGSSLDLSTANHHADHNDDHEDDDHNRDDDLTGDPDEVLTTVVDLQPHPVDPDETQAIPWRFQYDPSDDLGGLLAASSPLLSRAFRGGAKRPR